MVERVRDGSNLDMTQTLAQIAALKGRPRMGYAAAQAAEAALRRRREFLRNRITLTRPGR